MGFNCGAIAYVFGRGSLKHLIMIDETKSRQFEFFLKEKVSRTGF